MFNIQHPHLPYLAHGLHGHAVALLPRGASEELDANSPEQVWWLCGCIALQSMETRRAWRSTISVSAVEIVEGHSFESPYLFPSCDMCGRKYKSGFDAADRSSHTLDLTLCFPSEATAFRESQSVAIPPGCCEVDIRDDAATHKLLSYSVPASKIRESFSREARQQALRRRISVQRKPVSKQCKSGSDMCLH